MNNEILKKTINKISNQNLKNPEFLENLQKEEYKKLIENMYLRFLNSGVIENEVVINNPEEFIDYISNLALDTDIISYNLEEQCPIEVLKDRLGNMNVQAKNIRLDIPHVIAYYSNKGHIDNSQLVYYSPKREERKIEGTEFNQLYPYKLAKIANEDKIRKQFLSLQEKRR